MYDENELLARRAAVFKAMGHPTRLRFVEALAEGEKCVCELQPLTGHDMSTVSKHLGVLREAGVVAVTKRGNNVYYRLRMVCVAQFARCVDSLLKKGDATLGLDDLRTAS